MINGEDVIDFTPQKLILLFKFSSHFEETIAAQKNQYHQVILLNVKDTKSGRRAITKGNS